MRGRKNDKRNDKETQMNEVVNEKDNNNEGVVMTDEEDTIRTHNEGTSDEGPVPITGDYINDNNIINIDNNSFFISITTWCLRCVRYEQLDNTDTNYTDVYILYYTM